MKISILRPATAFLPECDAYSAYFRAHNHEVVFSQLGKAAPKSDLYVIPVGMYPFWNRPSGGLVLLDVASRSAGRMKRLRDFAKGMLNVKGDLVVYQSDYVRHGRLAHGSEVRYRSMGYFSNLVPKPSDPEFDLVYAGTVSRRGVLTAIERLARVGYRIAVVGSRLPRGFEERSNVSWFGRMSLEDTYALYGRALAGLNLVPNQAPFCMQQSTKLIEYVACGLSVFTTDYPWVLEFESSRRASFGRVQSLYGEKIDIKRPATTPPIDDLDWMSIMRSLDANGWINSRIHG